jgi:hypothetical protein
MIASAWSRSPRASGPASSGTATLASAPPGDDVEDRVRDLVRGVVRVGEGLGADGVREGESA